MRLQKTYKDREAQRFALEPAPYGASWPEVADDADVIFVYEKEPHKRGAHFYFLLACELGRILVHSSEPASHVIVS